MSSQLNTYFNSWSLLNLGPRTCCKAGFMRFLSVEYILCEVLNNFTGLSVFGEDYDLSSPSIDVSWNFYSWTDWHSNWCLSVCLPTSWITLMLYKPWFFTRKSFVRENWWTCGRCLWVPSYMTMKIVILLWGAGMAATTVVNFLAASIHGTASNATLTKSLHEALVSRWIPH